MWETIIGILGFLFLVWIIYNVVKAAYREARQKKAEEAFKNLSPANKAKVKKVPSIEDFIELERYLKDVKSKLTDRKVKDPNDEEDKMYQ